MICIILPVVSAQIEVNFQIFEEKVLVEINFGEVSNLKFNLPEDYSIFETNIDNYEIKDSVLYVNNSKDLFISYATESLIEMSKTKYFFIFNNDFNEILNITLFLPEGRILEDLIFPNPDEILTDGHRIFLKWNNFNEEEIVVSYNVIKQSNIYLWYLLGAIIVGFLIFYSYKIRDIGKKLKILKKKSKKRSKEQKEKDITRNLFGEEKKIIEYLFNKKGRACWTKEIVRDLEISKVRLSRRLRNLQQKGLIEKIPHGNENRIKLLKKE